MATATRANGGEVGVYLQSSETDTSGTTATYAHDLYSGLPRPVQSEGPIEVSNSTDMHPGLWKSEQHWEMDLVAPAHPKAIGAWLKAYFGAATTSGTDPYTHPFIRSATPGFVTVFATRPGGQYEKFAAGTVHKVGLAFEAGQPLKLNVGAMGKTPSKLASVYTSTNTETMDSDGPFFSYIGSTLKLDVAATPASTTVTNIKSGTIEFTRGVTMEQTNALNPSHRGLGLYEGGVSLDVLWEDYTAMLATFYGSTTGSASSQTIVFGSIEFRFEVGPTSDTVNKRLTVAVPNVRLAVPEPPDVDPSAAPLTMTVAGSIIKGAGEFATATLINNVVSYT